MTVNSAFELEDDDFFTDVFRSIPENDLLASTLDSCETNKANLKVVSREGAAKVIKKIKVYGTPLEECSQSLLKKLKCDKDNGTAKLSENTGLDTGQELLELKNNESVIKINNRFNPGFIPRSRKRIFPGPAGIIYEDEFQDKSAEKSSSTLKHFSIVINEEDIVSSQFSSEELSQPAWIKLKHDVFSQECLLSTAKYYSICRVLNEASKKKLPKHIVVPVLCVLIKKLDKKDSTPIFMDDTGEIHGKIDKEVLNLYPNEMKEGSALVLKEVTFLCNILLLKKKNIITIYGSDESVIYVQELNSSLVKEPLQRLNCGCSGVTCSDARTAKMESSSESCSSPQVPSCSNYKIYQNSTKQSSSKLSSNGVIAHCTTGKNVSNSDCVLDDIVNSVPPTSLKSILPNHELNRKHESKQIYSVNDAAVIEKDLFCEDSIDDFDELLGSLDEKSFLE